MLPAATPGKVSAVGVKSSVPTDAVAFKLTTWGLPTALSAIVSVPAEALASTGRKATEMVQEVPALIVRGAIGQVLAVSMKF